MNKAIIYLGYFLLTIFFSLLIAQFYNLKMDGIKLNASPTVANVIIILLMLFVRKILKPELFSNRNQKNAIRVYKYLVLFITIILLIIILIVILFFIFFPMPISY